jgi:hypothetical protein
VSEKPKIRVVTSAEMLSYPHQQTTNEPDAEDPMPLRVVAAEAEAIVTRLFPEGGAPPGLKLELVRIIRQAELRGYQACLRYFDVDRQNDEPEAS